MESIRVASERTFAARVQEHPQYRMLSSHLGPPGAAEVRRRLMAQSLKLSDSMAPEAYRVARDAQRILGLTGELEIYQRSGAENASIHLVAEPILLEIHGSLLSLLGPDTLLGVFGHELGHYIAHGPQSPLRSPHSLTGLLGQVEMDRPFEHVLSKLSMLAELTADRVGLLVCQDLHAMLRLEMVTLTGLSSGALRWDTEAYLAQSRDLMEAALADGSGFYGRTHPEHNLRAYALWLFSETKTFQQLVGHGPGTRDLAEVDALLGRFFGSEGDQPAGLVLDYSRLGEPPRELHECGLAAAVIVAHADDAIVDEEIEAIESVFATLVPDWRAYLDYDVALARFHETAPVVIAGGADLLRTLFQLLVHVMGADGVIDSREVSMVLAIGRVLGVEAEYRRWLASTVTALRVDVKIEATPTAELPLPARRGDVATAFEAFLSGVLRRGQTSITLRRLLRLCGNDKRTVDVINTIVEAFRARGIVTDVDLHAFPLDQRIDLVAPKVAAGPEIKRPLEIPASREGLASALRRLREQLVSGDGRSPSVRLRKTRRGRAFDLMDLDRVSVGLADRVLMQVRESGRSVRLLEAAEVGRHRAASNAATDLLALVREHEARLEETGAHDLYLGSPFLTGIVSGYAVRAPLVLYPVNLERDGSGARGYRLSLRKDEPPIVNQSLLRLVFNKKGWGFSDELADELDTLAGDREAGPDAVRLKLVERGLVTLPEAGALVPFADRDADLTAQPDFIQIEPCAVLGIFPQSKSDLLQDYDGLLQQLADPSVDVGRLLAAGAVMLPDSLVGARPREQAVGATSGAVSAPLILADPSQRAVIAQCLLNGATVVDGPPGTGKSQVIVNLVADALGRGERVAVVCEKRAALDVVSQRLEGLGLRHAVAVVHDVHEDRKALYAQITARLESTDVRPFDAAEADLTQQEHDGITKELTERASLLCTRPLGLDMSVGELFALDSGMNAVGLRSSFGLERLAQSQLDRLQTVATSLHPLADLWGAQSIWRAPREQPPRPSLAQANVSLLRSQIAQAIDAARAYETQAQRSPVHADVVEQSRSAIEAARRSRQARNDTTDRTLFSVVLHRSADSPERLRSVSDAQDAWQQASEATTRVAIPVHIAAAPELVQSLSVLRAWAGQWTRFFVVAWWLARFAFRREMARAWPERSGDALTSQLFDEVADRIAASNTWRTIGAAFDGLAIRHLMPNTASDLGAIVGRLHRVGPAVREVATARASLTSAAAWPAVESAPDQALERWDAALEDRIRLLDARDALRAAMVPVVAALPWIGELAESERLAQWLVALERDGSRLQESDALMQQASAILPSAPALFDALASQLPNLTIPVWRDAITKTWSLAWVARLERELPGLSRLGTRADDHHVSRLSERYRELEQDLRELENERVLARLDGGELVKIEAPGKHQRRTAGQKLREELLKETRKKKRLMALRSFVRRYAPQGLLDVTPVWLLSPETMAILFPREPLFDLVVFDEASQCTVEAGFPVLLRAKRVVIAGDEQQMPPSSYFTMGSSDDDDAPEGEEAPSDEKQAVKDLLGAESLLTLARHRVPHAGLKWHYRCRDESLIAFSNHAMYEGGLLTIPATAGPAAPSALHWVSVENGVYDGGENRPEAARVAQLIDELLAREEVPTIGVVTFNLKQRKAVLDALDERVAKEPDFARRWGDAKGRGALDERPFVKSLEQVQGDERDVIIFSLGHAPQERSRRGSTTSERYVAARFGPLGQRGGERRLNVAISRAKSECFIVSSFEPSLLDVKTSRNAGPRLFKQFLQFAFLSNHGRRQEAQGVLELLRQGRRLPPSQAQKPPRHGYTPLSIQIADALTVEGIPHELKHGTSDFQVPLGVLDPTDPTRFRLAIMTDEGRETASPFETRVHRPDVLRTRKWEVLHITSAAWHRRRAELIEEIVALVPGARGATHSEAYIAHRASRRAATPVPALAEPPRVKSSTQPPPPAPPSVEPVIDAKLPDWVRSITDPFFRKALLHLEAHGSLSESELVNIAGGARRARKFGVELEGWRAMLPFHVEMSDVGGTKLYRKMGPR